MKISAAPESSTKITMNTRPNNSVNDKAAYKWWTADSEKELTKQVLSTVAFLKESQGDRLRQAALYARLYGNMSLFNFASGSAAKGTSNSSYPVDRPTFNLVQSAADTLVSRIGQQKPQPKFLTDAGNYKERNLAKKLNNFILGEFYNTKAYEKATIMLRDALVEGTGVLKVYEDSNKKVQLERVFFTELFTDPNESMYGEPRQLHQVKLVDRSVLLAGSEKKSIVKNAESAFPDNTNDSSKSVADLVMVVESWHLKSGKDSKDGRHTIVCSSGTILDEDWDKDNFPFVFLHYSPRLLGFWAQGLAEQLMGTQIEINSLLFTISKAMKLVGVPRVFIEEGSKVVKAHLTDEIGALITYRGVKPSYEVAPVLPAEMYSQLQRLIDYGYQQCGVSSMQAGAQKPAGLNSGEAIRSYDDISTDRFASLSAKYDQIFKDLAYLMIDCAKDIAEREGEYETIFPDKRGTKSIELPQLKMLKNSFVIQVFNQSSLPRDPAGRMQKVTEMIQSGMISVREGRRLLDYPDLEQIENLANASEERIFYILDKIIDEGEFTPPDPFLDLDLATQFSVQYINLYSTTNLADDEEKMQMLRDFYTQVGALKQGAQAAMAPPPQPGNGAPQANPEALPTSPLVPNAPGMAA